jgi:hypothetical protein
MSSGQVGLDMLPPVHAPLCQQEPARFKMGESTFVGTKAAPGRVWSASSQVSG